MKSGRITPLENRRNTTDRMNQTTVEKVSGDYASAFDFKGSTARGKYEIQYSPKREEMLKRLK